MTTLKQKVVRPFKTCVNCWDIQFNGKKGELPKACQDCSNYQLMIHVKDVIERLQQKQQENNKAYSKMPNLMMKGAISQIYELLEELKEKKQQ